MVFKKNLNSYLMRVLGEINQKILIFYNLYKKEFFLDKHL